MRSSKLRMLCGLTIAFYFCAILNLQFEVAQARFHAVMKAEASKSRIFIIGSTGRFGRFVVEASVKAKHPTVALVRPNTIATDTEKAALVENFRTLGVQIVLGDINVNRSTLVTTMKQVDVVISCIGGLNILDQTNIISAITEAGNIKRFFPSEYAIDVDRLDNPVEPAKTLFANKATIRRAVEAARVPHTFVVANGFSRRFWPNLAQLGGGLLPNLTDVEAFGNGNAKITSTSEADVATYVIKTVDDPKTLNKNLYLRPRANIISFNDLFTLWEKKSGKILNKTYVPEAQLLTRIQEAPFGQNILLAVCFSVAIKDNYASYAINPSFGIEGTTLYPEVKYETVNAFLNQYFTSNSSFVPPRIPKGGPYF